MRNFLLLALFLMTGLAALGQGEVRYIDTIEGLLRQNPYASGTGSRAVYAVGRRTTNSPSGSVRFAIWSTSTNLTANGTNVFASPFGGRWVFPDKDDPLQNADWYSQTNRWSLDSAGNLVLGTTNVAGDLAALRTLLGTKANVVDLSGYSTTNHNHPVADLRDSTPLTRDLLKEVDPIGIRSLLLLGNSATRNVGTTSNDVAQGDHNHDTEYEAIGTAAQLITIHEGRTNPHAVYILGMSGTGSNLTIVGGTVSGSVALSLGTDLATSGSHRLLVRDSSSGQMRTMDLAYFKGWLDMHASNIVDAGATGIQILQSAEKTNALDALGSGRSPSLFLRGDGSWSTAVSTNASTNSLPEAPNDGTAYARKNLAWTGLAIADVSGLSSYGRSWVAIANATNAASALMLLGTNTLTIDSPAKYSVRVGSGGSTITRHRINLIAGTGITTAVADDSVDDEADVTVSVSTITASQISDSTVQGRAILTNSTAASQRTVLGLGTAATNNVPASGDASALQVVLGSDTRLTNSRVPVTHTHLLADLPTVGSSNVLGRKSAGTGVTEQITPAELAAILMGAGLSTGTVKSVSLAMPGIFSVAGSPVTNTGTLSVSMTAQAQKKFLVGPATGVDASPSFRLMETTDLPAAVWTSINDGTGSGLDSDLLDGQHGAFYLSRANHSGTQPWTTISSTPTTLIGYGITDAASNSTLQAHIANTVIESSRPHGIGQFGGTLAASETAEDAWDRLELGSAAFRFVPTSGNATNDPGHGAEVVLATDTRLTDVRTPSAHGHAVSGITNVTSQRILGRISTNAGPAEELTFSQIATGIVASGLAPTGTVRSVTLSAPQSSIFATFGNPITNTGTIGFTMIQQGPHTFLGGAASGDVSQFPTFRNLVLADLPAEVWTSQNDGAASLLDAGLLAGQGVSYYLARSNHSGSINWTNVASTPTTVDGYGITDALKLSGGTLTGLLYAPRIEVTNGIRTELFRRTESDTPPIGITYQSGSGIPGDSYGWTYPSGTKLSVNRSSSTTTWELMNTTSSLLSPTGSMAFRIGGYIPGGGWAPWRVLVDDNTIANYAPTKTGSGASGTWGISIIGNAATATTVPWSGVTGTPTTKSGYGITDVPTYTDLASHTNLTIGAHGMTAFGASLVDDATSSDARTTLELGTSATLNVAASGNAASGEVVKGNDSRLTDSRTPSSHTHPVSELSDGGTIGRQIVQAAAKTNVLNLLGSGGATGLYLSWDGWVTGPSPGSTTNGVGEAPTNGLAYARKNAGWTQVSMSDISGMSVGLSVPGPFSVSGSPVTSSGTLAVSVSNQVQKTFWAGPVSGANAPPAFRTILDSDLPNSYWYAGNDGSGSGLDADLLDAQSGAYYLARGNHTGTQAWSTISSTPTTVDGYGITDALKLSGGTLTGALVGTSSKFTNGVSILTSTRQESAFTAPVGVSVQNGDGASDTNGWTYPYQGKLTVRESANRAWEIGNTSYPDGSMAYRINSNGVAWMPWKIVVDSLNYTNYAPTKTGSGASGTWGIDITGSASVASNVAWSGVTGTPTTKSGYGLTDVPTYSDLAAHTNLTAGAHGISSFGATLVDDASASSARTTLGLGTSAVRNSPSSGNAATNETVLGDDTRLSDSRTPLAHTHPWSDVSSTPTTLSGYGITDAATISDLAAHTNLTAGAHGISAFGSTLVDDASASAARTTLGLGTVATLNVAASGNATPSEVVKGDDTRLSNSRTPTAHSHQTTELTNVASKTVVGRLTSGTGTAEQISLSNLVSALRTDGGLGIPGTVTNVALSMPGIFSVSGSPITTGGTLTVGLANQSPAMVFAGPVTGAVATPSFRAIALSDIPGGVWTTVNMGSGSGMNADLVDGFDSSYMLNRTNHTGTQSWSTIHGTPTTTSGYGITDAATDAELQAHAATTSGVHGISSFGATLVDDTTAASARTTLGLGTAALLDVPSSGDASLSQAVKGNDSRLTDARTPLTHNHDDRYDISGTASYQMFVHTNNADPHPQYMLESGGSSVNQSASGITISGNSTIGGNVSLSLSDVGYSGSHRFVIRGSSDGLAYVATPSYVKGLLDYRIADISDSGSIGQSIVRAGSVGTALDVLGSGRSSSLYLRGDGTWATPPSGGGATNGITDAPSDGTAYVRKSASWTGLAIADVSGLTTYGKNWATLMTSASDARENLGLMGGSVVTIDSPAKLSVRMNDTGSGAARHRINFTPGNGISLSVSDDSVADENDVFIGLATGDYGDVVVGGGGSTMTVDSGAISYSKIQNVSAGKILGRTDASSGSVQEITPGTGLAVSGTSLVVNPATFTTGEILCAISDEVEITGGSLTDDTWHSILGNPRAGSKTISANAVPVNGIIKIEMHGECGFDYSGADGIAKVRVNVGNNFSATMTFNEDGSLPADNETPWSVTILLTLKSGNVVRASGGWTYSVTSTGTTSGQTYTARVVPVGTINPTVANAISAEFRGVTIGGSFTQFRCDQTIVTRY